MTLMQAKIFGKELELRQDIIDRCLDMEETPDLAAQAMYVRAKQDISDDKKILNLLNKAIIEIEALDQTHEQSSCSTTIPKTKPNGQYVC